METLPHPVDTGHGHAFEVIEEQTDVLWRRERITTQALAKTVHPGMEPAAYGVLALLQREGPLRVTDVARSIGVGKPCISRQLGALERLGLVRRQPDPVNSRSHRIRLTALAEQRLDAARTARRAEFTSRLRSWTPEDVIELSDLIARLNSTYTKDPW